MAYNYTNNFIYAYDNTDKSLHKIDSMGNAVNLGVIQGLNTTVNMFGGDFDSTGVLVLNGHINDPNMYRIDVQASPPTVVLTIQKSYSSGTGIPVFGDFALNRENGLFYGLDASGIIHTLDPYTGIATPISANTAGPVHIGGAFFGAGHQSLYGYGKDVSTQPSSKLYRCSLQTGICIQVAQGISSNNIDGCSCNPLCQSTIDSLFLNTCAGDSLFAGGSFQTNPGIYYDSALNHLGCDSIIISSLSFY